MISDIASLPEEHSQFIPSDIQYLLIVEIIVHHKTVGYVYLMDYQSKKTDHYTNKEMRLLWEFIEAINVLVSKQHPTWIDEQGENAELAVDLLHHIQYPIKRVSAVANEIKRSSDRLQDFIATFSTSNGSTADDFKSKAQDLFYKIEQNTKIFKTELKLVDELMENSFQLHLLRSPNLSKISCEYDYILNITNISSYIQHAANSFANVFNLKHFKISFDDCISDLSHIYVHTSLLWITLYWCCFQILFLPLYYEVHLMISYEDSPTLGQHVIYYFTLHEIASSSTCPSAKLQNHLIRAGSATKIVVGEFSFEEINESFRHFVSLFNVIMNETSSLSSASSIIFNSSADYFEDEETHKRLLQLEWELQIPLNITANNHTVKRTTRSRSISAHEYSAKFRNNPIVQRNNSIDAADSLSNLVKFSNASSPRNAQNNKYNRKIRPPIRRSRDAGSNKSSPMLAMHRTDSQSSRASPEQHFPFSSSSHDVEDHPTFRIKYDPSQSFTLTPPSDLGGSNVPSNPSSASPKHQQQSLPPQQLFSSPSKKLLLSNQINNRSTTILNTSFSVDSHDPHHLPPERTPYLLYLDSLAQSIKKPPVSSSNKSSNKSSSNYNKEIPPSATTPTASPVKRKGSTDSHNTTVTSKTVVFLAEKSLSNSSNRTLDDILPIKEKPQAASLKQQSTTHLTQQNSVSSTGKTSRKSLSSSSSFPVLLWNRIKTLFGR